MQRSRPDLDYPAPIVRNGADGRELAIAPAGAALAVQRPLPDGALVVVARGEKRDPPAERTPERLLL